VKVKVEALMVHEDTQPCPGHHVLVFMGIYTGASIGQKCGVDAHGECTEREPITGSGGRAPSRVQEQSPWSGIRGKASPP